MASVTLSRKAKNEDFLDEVNRTFTQRLCYCFLVLLWLLYRFSKLGLTDKYPAFFVQR